MSHQTNVLCCDLLEFVHHNQTFYCLRHFFDDNDDCCVQTNDDFLHRIGMMNRSMMGQMFHDILASIRECAIVHMLIFYSSLMVTFCPVKVQNQNIVLSFGVDR